MVPLRWNGDGGTVNSPRIRGDGPVGHSSARGIPPFSPYSRGWSPWQVFTTNQRAILPVFAGMVRRVIDPMVKAWDSPRIRGDGPDALATVEDSQEFSPYSRGWSLHELHIARRVIILPVFAGMVPRH